jgi:predicted ribosome quality control (RQC) complex YloA/Tae2 family protein
VIGSRLQNIYDLNPKTLLLKLNPKEGDEKLKLVIESGARLHSTAYDFETASGAQPSFFAMRLRKWLRDRRVTGFEQLGFDRVVRMEFSHQNPEMVLNLYLEFFSAVRSYTLMGRLNAL